MKTIGTCKTCKWWDTKTRDVDTNLHSPCICPKTKSAAKDGTILTKIGEELSTGSDYGCVHWKYWRVDGNYKPTTAERMKCDDLQRENDALVESNLKMATALYELGFDTTKGIA